MSDFFAKVAEELDRQAASIVKTIARRAVTPIQTSDEAQLQQLERTLSTLTQAARDSFVWRCGLVTVCADDPGALTPNSSAVIPPPQSANDKNQNQEQAPRITPLDTRISVIARLTDLLSLIFVAHTYFTSGGSEHEFVFKKTQTVTLLAVLSGACDVPFLSQPLCASILEALNACLQDFLGVVHAEHSVNNSFSSSSSSSFSSHYDRRKFPRKLPLTFSIHAHRYLLRSLSRRIFQPLYASWLISALGSPEGLSPFPGSSSSSSSSNTTNKRNRQHHQHQNLAHDNNNNINQSGLTNPFNSTGFGHTNMLASVSSGTSKKQQQLNSTTTQESSVVSGGGQPVTSDGDAYYSTNDDDNDIVDSSKIRKSASSTTTKTKTKLGFQVHEDDSSSSLIQDHEEEENERLRKARDGLNSHSCFLKDAVIRIICGGFLGDGPSASPHSYVAIALNILSTILLVPLGGSNDDDDENSNNNSSNSTMTISVPTTNDASSTTSTIFNKRAGQIFAPKSVEGMAAIAEALIRRTIFSSSSSSKSSCNPQNQGNLAATFIMNNISASGARRMMKFFWALRPLIQSLSTCPLTKQAFLKSESTRQLFDLLWKTLASMIDVIDAVEQQRMNNTSTFYADDDEEHNNNNNSSTITVKSNPDASVSFMTTKGAGSSSPSFSSSSKRLLQAIVVICSSILPLAIALWKGVNSLTSSSDSSSSSSNNRKFADTIFVFARKASLILVPPPSSSSSSTTTKRQKLSHHTPTSQELIIAFDSLVSAMEYTASIQTTPTLNTWLKEASSEICSIHLSNNSNNNNNSDDEDGNEDENDGNNHSSSSMVRHIQSQWSTLLIALSIDDSVLRCLFSSTIGRSPEFETPPHLVNYLKKCSNNSSSSSSSTSSSSFALSPISMMMISVDTALRDAVSHDGEKEASIPSTPDQIYGALSAISGSPLYNHHDGKNMDNDDNTNNFLPNPILKRALLKLASLAADQVSCRDLCRVFLRSDQSIAPTSWGLVVENSFSSSSEQNNNNNNTTSRITNKMMNMTSSFFNNNNNNHSSSSNEGLTAALQIELAQQKSLNFDLQRELQKRSNESGVQDAKIRALHETVNQMEAETNQHRAAAETMRDMLERERQTKQQMLQSEHEMRSQFSQMAERLRQLEGEKEQIEMQAQVRVREAEERARQKVIGHVRQMESELKETKEKLSVSEERVNRFVELHNTFSQMSKGV